MKKSELWQNFLQGERPALRDFSYAGQKRAVPAGKRYEARDFGVAPDTDEDMTGKIQFALDSIGKAGGGTLALEPGRYLLGGSSPAERGVALNYSNVTIAGAGSGCDGTVFYAEGHTLREGEPWLTKGLFHTGRNLLCDRFLSPKMLGQPIPILCDAAQGARGVCVPAEEAKRLPPGECVILCMYDSPAGDLARELIWPLEPDEAWSDLLTANERGSAPYQWLAEVSRTEGGEVWFDRPILREIRARYRPCLYRVPMLEDIALCDIRIESAWDGGGYYHHKNPEVDYGWNGVVFHRVRNGCIRNVWLHQFTQGIQLRDCKNVTVREITISGQDGHYGVKCYAHTTDCLVDGVDIYPAFTHGLGVEGTVQGNVFRKVRFHSAATEIDLHGGGLPAFNLFEEVEGIAKISGGGAVFNLPYCGQGNVYWNCSFSPCPPKGRLSTYLEREGISGGVRQKRLTEVFHAWYWSYQKQLDSYCDHKMYPQSIVRGLRGPGTIDQTPAARREDAVWVENVSGEDEIPSLYSAQCRRRKNMKERGAEKK